MDRTQRLLLLSPALLAVLTLGAADGSRSTAAPVSAQTAAVNVPQGKATETPDEKPRAYRDAYRKGYTDAGNDCGKAESFSYNGSDWDRRGWVDGYNAGHANLCEGTG